MEQHLAFQPTCVHRCVRVYSVSDLIALADMLSPHRAVLAAVGLAVGAVRRHNIAEMLVRCGVHRVCAVGMMQHPPLSWQHGGRPRLADWVEWSGWD